MFEAKSALASALAKGGREGADGRRRCRLGERRGYVLLQVAGFPATIAEVERVLPAVLGVPPPRTLSETVAVGAGRVPRLGRDEGRQEIVARHGPALGDEIPEVFGQPLAGDPAAERHFRVHRKHDGVETAGQIEAPRLEALVVLDGHAEHLADHRDGDRVGELLDQIHRAGRLGARDEAVDDLLDARAQPLYDARGECLAHEAAEPRVVRRIAVRDFGESGDPVALYKKFGLSIDNIVAEAKKLVKK